MSEIVPFPGSGDGRQTDGGSGGGGSSGGSRLDLIEHRLGRLETDVSEMKGDLRSISSDLSEMKGRLNSMPTVRELLSMTIATWMAGAMLVALIVRLT